MIRTSQLHGMGVVDVDSAAKLGEIDELFFDLERRSFAGVSVSRGGTLLSGEDHLLLPAAAIESIGEDAVMVRSGVLAEGLELHTRASSLTGRAVVTEGGTHLGAIDDILFEEGTGHIIGYAFAERDSSRGPNLGGLFGMGRKAEGHDTSIVDYVRADAGPRFGDLVVVPDAAVVRNEKLTASRASDNVTVTRTPPATAR